MGLTKNKFWVFGDSFCDGRWTLYVQSYIRSKYPNSLSTFELFNYAEGSSDLQTIIDNWIRIIPHMKEDDVIVVCLPDISRARFPKKMKCVKNIRNNNNSNNAPPLNSYFMFAPAGWDPSNPLVPSINETDVMFNSNEDYRKYSWNTNILLNTEAYDNSKIDIIEALYKITPCKKKFIYTWVKDNRLNSDNIHSKKWITENVLNGKWETLGDSWISSGGKIGKQHDFHLSDACEKMMCEFFIKEFEL